MTTEYLERSFASTRAIVANVTPGQFVLPTPCASWDVRALLNHIIGNAFYFADTVNEGRRSSVDRGDLTGGDMVETYDDGIEKALAAFRTSGALDKMLAMHFGNIPGSVFIQIATTDVFLHGWDLARATGQPTDLDPELARRQLDAARALIRPESRGPDTQAPFGPEQTAPEGASAADQLASFLGRRVLG